jgi:hypothetical protein
MRLCRDTMLVVRRLPIAEDGLEALAAHAPRRQPFAHVLVPERDDAALVAGGGDLRRGPIRHRGV